MTRALVAVVLLVLLVGGAVALISRDPGQQPSDPPPTGDARILASSASCQECHQQVYDEWRQSQHSISFTNPLVLSPEMTDGFRKKDCVPCHAPRPVFEYGLGKAARVLARDTDRFFGVDCLACHRVGSGVAASRPGLSGPCNPVFRPELLTTDLCAPCHNQHNTVDEWELSPVDLRGKNCNHCHLPAVERPAGAGGPAHTGRFHGSRGGNDIEMLRRSSTVTWQVATDGADRRLDVTVTNSGTAHNLPADARHRAIDLVVRLLDAGGRQVGDAVDGGPGQTGGSARLRFRNPYRDEYGKVNTQIPSGEARTLPVPFGSAATQAEILLFYKRTPFVPDEEASVVFRQTFSL